MKFSIYSTIAACTLRRCWSRDFLAKDTLSSRHTELLRRVMTCFGSKSATKSSSTSRLVNCTPPSSGGGTTGRAISGSHTIQVLLIALVARERFDSIPCSRWLALPPQIDWYLDHDRASLLNTFSGYSILWQHTGPLDCSHTFIRHKDKQKQMPPRTES